MTPLLAMRTIRALTIRADAASKNDAQRPTRANPSLKGRRAALRSIAAPLVLGSVFNFEGEKPQNLGVQSFNGETIGLALCPSTPNCVGTADEFSDAQHYVPAWTYVDEEKVARGAARTTREEAMGQLIDVVETTDCDGFAATIVDKREDYLRVEYKSKIFGFVDDVEFWFPQDQSAKEKARVEYRSASRLGQSDGDVNRKRIRALRLALTQKYGWKSVGFS